MKKAIQSWKRSLGVAARSYRIVVVLAALIALWAYLAYAWLGLPAESSGLLMILSFIWAVAQILIGVGIVAGTIAGAAEASATDARCVPLRALWTVGAKKLFSALILGVLALAFVAICSSAFDWINDHSVEVASFLTFHAEKPVSHIAIEKIYAVFEGLLWIVLCGFLLSLLVAVLHEGWLRAGKRSWKFLDDCAFRAAFLTSLLSVVFFGGIAYALATWHPVAPPGFWDYAQVVGRISLALIFISAGVLFWSLSLARLQTPNSTPAHV